MTNYSIPNCADCGNPILDNRGPSVRCRACRRARELARLAARRVGGPPVGPSFAGVADSWRAEA